MTARKESVLKAFKESFSVHFRNQLRIFEEFKQKVAHNRIDVIEQVAVSLGKHVLQSSGDPVFVGPFAVKSVPPYMKNALTENASMVASFAEQEIYQLMVGLGLIEAVLQEISFEITRIFEYQIFLLSQSHRLSLLCEFIVDKIFVPAKHRYLITFPDGAVSPNKYLDDVIQFSRNDILNLLFETEAVFEEDKDLYQVLHASEVVTVHTGDLWNLSDIFTHTGLITRKEGKYDYFTSLDYADGYKTYGFRHKIYLFDDATGQYLDHPNDLVFDQPITPPTITTTIRTLGGATLFQGHFLYVPHHISIKQDEFDAWWQAYQKRKFSTTGAHSAQALIPFAETMVSSLASSRGSSLSSSSVGGSGGGASSPMRRASSMMSQPTNQQTYHTYLFHEVTFPVAVVATTSPTTELPPSSSSSSSIDPAEQPSPPAIVTIPFRGIDFDGCCFYRKIWQGYDFNHCKFDGSLFFHCQLDNCLFAKCSLRSMYLVYCYLSRIELLDYKITSFLHLSLNYSWITASNEWITLLQEGNSQEEEEALLMTTTHLQEGSNVSVANWQEKELMVINKTGTIFLQEHVINTYYQMPYFFPDTAITTNHSPTFAGSNGSVQKEEKVVQDSQSHPVITTTTATATTIIFEDTGEDDSFIRLPERTVSRRQSMSKLPSLYPTSNAITTTITNTTPRPLSSAGGGHSHFSFSPSPSTTPRHLPSSSLSPCTVDTLTTKTPSPIPQPSQAPTLILRTDLYQEFVDFVVQHQEGGMMSTAVAKGGGGGGKQSQHVLQLILGEEGVGETSLVLSYLQYHVLATYPKNTYWIQWFDASNTHQLYLSLLSWISHLQLVIPPHLRSPSSSHNGNGEQKGDEEEHSPEEIELLLYYIVLQLMTLQYEKIVLIFYHVTELSTVLTQYFIPMCLKYHINTSLFFQMIILPPNSHTDYTLEQLTRDYSLTAYGYSPTATTSPVAIQILHMHTFTTDELHTFLTPKLASLPYAGAQMTSDLEDIQLIQQLGSLLNNHPLALRLAIAYIKQQQLINRYEEEVAHGMMLSTNSMEESYDIIANSSTVNDLLDGLGGSFYGSTNTSAPMRVYGLQEYIHDFLHYQMSLSDEENYILQCFSGNIQQTQLTTRDIIGISLLMKTFQLKESPMLLSSISSTNSVGSRKNQEGGSLWKILYLLSHVGYHLIPLTLLQNLLFNERELFSLLMILQDYEVLQLFTVELPTEDSEQDEEPFPSHLFATTPQGHKQLIPYVHTTTLQMTFQSSSTLPSSSSTAKENKTTMFIQMHPMIQEFYRIYFANSFSTSSSAASSSSLPILDGDTQQSYAMELMELLSLQLQSTIQTYQTVVTASTATPTPDKPSTVPSTLPLSIVNQSESDFVTVHVNVLLQQLLILLPHAIFVIDEHLPVALAVASLPSPSLLYVNSLWKLLTYCIQTYVLFQQFNAAKPYIRSLLLLLESFYPSSVAAASSGSYYSLEMMSALLTQSHYCLSHGEYEDAWNILQSPIIQTIPAVINQPSLSPNQTSLLFLYVPFLWQMSECHMRLQSSSSSIDLPPAVSSTACYKLALDMFQRLHTVVQHTLLSSLSTTLSSRLQSIAEGSATSHAVVSASVSPLQALSLLSMNSTDKIHAKGDTKSVIVLSHREYEVFTQLASILQSLGRYFMKQYLHYERASNGNEANTTMTSIELICSKYYQLALQIRMMLAQSHHMYKHILQLADHDQPPKRLEESTSSKKLKIVIKEDRMKPFSIPLPPTNKGEKVDDGNVTITVSSRHIDEELLSLYLEIGELLGGEDEGNTTSYHKYHPGGNSPSASYHVFRKGYGSCGSNPLLDNPGRAGTLILAKAYFEKVLYLNESYYEEYAQYYQVFAHVAKLVQQRELVVPKSPLTEPTAPPKKSALSNLFGGFGGDEPAEPEEVVPVGPTTNTDTALVVATPLPGQKQENYLAYLCNQFHTKSEQYAGILYALGRLYFTQQLYGEALWYLEECLNILQQIQFARQQQYKDIKDNNYDKLVGYDVVALQQKLFATYLLLAYVHQRYAPPPPPASSSPAAGGGLDHQEETIRKYLLPAMSILQSVKFVQDVLLDKCSVLLDIALSYQASQMHHHVIVFIEDVMDLCRNALKPASLLVAGTTADPAPVRSKEDLQRLKRLLLTSYLVASVSYYRLHRYHYAYVLHDHALTLFDDILGQGQGNKGNDHTVDPKTALKKEEKSGLYAKLSDYYRNEVNYYLPAQTFAHASHFTARNKGNTSSSSAAATMHPIKQAIHFLQQHFPFHREQLALLLYSPRYISSLTRYFLIEENVYMFQEENALLAMEKMLSLPADKPMCFPLSVCMDVLKECCDFTWNYNQESYLDLAGTSTSSLVPSATSASTLPLVPQQHRNENSVVKKGHTIARQTSMLNYFTNKVVLETTLIKYQQQYPASTGGIVPNAANGSDTMIGIQAIYHTLVKCGFQLGTLDTQSHAVTNHEWISFHKVIFLLQLEWKYRQSQVPSGGIPVSQYAWRENMTLSQSLVHDLLSGTLSTTSSSAAPTRGKGTVATPMTVFTPANKHTHSAFSNRKDVLYRFYLELLRYNPHLSIPFSS